MLISKKHFDEIINIQKARYEELQQIANRALQINSELVDINKELNATNKVLVNLLHNYTGLKENDYGLSNIETTDNSEVL